MKHILVTGGAGFIGKALLTILSKDTNNNLVSLDNYSTGTEDNHVEGVQYLRGCITEIDKILKSTRCVDIIYHLAAQSRIQPSFTDPEKCFFYNVTGTLKVLEFAKLNESKVIYAGSSSASKLDTPGGKSPYSLFKYQGEEICNLYREVFGLNVEIARFYNVYGPGEITEGHMAAVIGKFRYALDNKLPLSIVGDGEQRRDFTHVDDIAEGLIAIAKSKASQPHWQLGTGINYSINEVVKMFGSNINTVYVEDQPGNYRETLAHLTKENKQLLNWVPKRVLEDYIKSL